MTCFTKQETRLLNFNGYSSMVSEARNKAKNQTTKGKGLKILTPKQIVQRLPIALAQVKSGNNSENYYSLYQLKEITKKVYNKIIKSIQL